MSDRFSVRTFAFALLTSLFLSVSALAWVPVGGPQFVENPECSSFALRDIILRNHTHPAQQMRAVQDFFNQCGDLLSKGAATDAGMAFAFQQLTEIEFSYPHFQDYIITRTDGTKLRGLLAMQPDDARIPRRPLVIVQCGIGCNQRDASIRQVLMHLYEEAPFHVLLVPSSTGTEFLADNGVWAMGGIDEGREIALLAERLQAPGSELASRISRVHVLGLSLGGHTAFYSALYSSYRSLPDGATPISSVLAACPVVDLQASLHHIFTDPMVSGEFLKFFLEQSKEASKDSAAFRQLFGDLSGVTEVTSEQAETMVSTAAFSYYSGKAANANWAIAPFHGIFFTSSSDVFNVSRFQSFADQVQLPVYVWGAQDDAIVGYDANSGTLKATLDAEGLGNGPISVLSTPHGNHCLYAHTYGWNISSMVMRALLISRSPELLDASNYHLRTIDASVPFPDKFKAIDADEKRVYLQWRAVPGYDKAKLAATIYKGDKCSLYTETDPDCMLRRQTVLVPLSWFGMTPPKDAGEAAATTRWLNANVRVSGKNLGRLEAGENPVQLDWISF